MSKQEEEDVLLCRRYVNQNSLYDPKKWRLLAVSLSFLMNLTKEGSYLSFKEWTVTNPIMLVLSHLSNR